MLHDYYVLNKTDFKECMAILNAYLVPPQTKAKLYPGISPVNSFRVILDSLYGGNFPLLPDRSYYATWDEPTKFTDVTTFAHEADRAPAATAKP
jgi:hypothetical protein